MEIRVPVSVEIIKPASIEEFVTTTATVSAMKTVLLKSEIEGRYRRAVNPATGREFAPGDKVQQGQTIVFLDSPEYENNIAIDSKKLNLDISKREFEKQQSLYEKGGVTLRELKNAEKSFIDARYAYENALLQLQKMKITAPFSGIIADLPYYTKGTTVSAGSDMVQIMDYKKLYADVFYPANEMKRIKTNQKLRVMHYSSAEDTLFGVVSQVSPALNPETRTFKASVTINNPDYILRPGMFVKIETVIERKDSVIVIPKNIILSKRRGKTVYVVEKGAAVSRVITVGLENSEQAEVIKGLDFGESLVIKGFETLGRRSKVKIVQ
jgi:RND family efflux transporter MFP subunit